MNVLKEKDVTKNFVARLQVMAKAYKKKWEAPLEHSQLLLYGWASGFYTKGYNRAHMINLIDRGVSTIVPFLVEGNPRLLIESKVANLRGAAYRSQLALNYLIDKKMNIAESTLIPVATNAIFSMGITRTFSEYNRLISINDEEIKLGEPKVAVIDPADYIGDPAAKNREDFVIEGDTYRVPTEYAKELYPKYADFIKPSGKLISKFGAEEISAKNFKWSQLNLREYTILQDIYVKDEGVIYTILPEGGRAVALGEVEYDGPGDGPYDYLNLTYFPGSPIAVPPAWRWNDLDVSMNILATTAREQAESQKNVVIAEPASKKAAKQILKANNMDVIIAKNAKGINTLSIGGVNPDNYNWMNFAELAFTKTGANPDVMGGRGAQAPTLGQEQLVFQNASRIVNNMYNRFHNFMTSVVNKLAYYVWTDPTVYIPVIEQIPGLGEVDIVFSQADNVADYYDFVFSIKAYSTQRMSPELHYQRLMQFMTQWVLPTSKIAASQGAELDVPTATKILAGYLGVENLNQFYKTAVPQELSDVSYTMQPNKNKNKFGQLSDVYGAMDVSREAQSQRVQAGQGFGGEAKETK